MSNPDAGGRGMSLKLIADNEKALKEKEINEWVNHFKSILNKNADIIKPVVKQAHIDFASISSEHKSWVDRQDSPCINCKRAEIKEQTEWIEREIESIQPSGTEGVCDNCWNLECEWNRFVDARIDEALKKAGRK
jgi:hypothetical protein